MIQLIYKEVISDELALAFSDGVECYLSLSLLRQACPCAACQGEPDALGRVMRPEPQVGEGGTRLTRIEIVGGYAIQLFWADGHSTGIYTFEYLRRLSAAQSS